MNDFLQTTFIGNSAREWLILAGVITAILIALRLIKFIVIGKIKKWADKTETTWDNFIIEVAERNVIPLLYVSAFYFPLLASDISDKITPILHIAFLISLTFFTLRTISAAFKKFIHSFIRRDEDGDAKEKQAAGLIVVANIIIWAVGVIFLVDNLGYNVTTLIAGLGVGGIAIALAAQAVLGDLFSYFVIFFDRPFEIGDFVTLDKEAGVIEYIGIKTTRIRTLSGEQLICSNTDLTNSRLHNYKRMEKRRVVFSIGVVYHTSGQKLAAVPEIVKNIIRSIPDVQLDRGHFSGFADSSIRFEFVYYVLDPDYNLYMDRQQSIYLAIAAEFEKHGIEFAYPTQTIFMAKEQQVNSSQTNQLPVTGRVSQS